MTAFSIQSAEATVGASAYDVTRRDVVDTTDLPHPPYRLPFLGDIVGLNPRIPFQSSLPQIKKLGPISARRMFGTDIVAVSGPDLVTEVHDETRFGKYVGHHLTALREITGEALFTAESDHPDWRLAHDILMPAFTPRGDAGVSHHYGERDPGFAGAVGWCGRQRKSRGCHRRHDTVDLGNHRPRWLWIPPRVVQPSATASVRLCDEPSAVVCQLVDSSCAGAARPSIHVTCRREDGTHS